MLADDPALLGPSSVERLLPEGAAPPEDIPAEVFGAALAAFLGLRRVDMSALAAELGIGRATLYRRAGSRDRLLGEVVWYLTRRALIPAIESADSLTGARRVLAIAESFMQFVGGQPGFRRFLDAEPEAALRILTSKHGPVQGGIVRAFGILLAEESARGMVLPLDEDTLAYVLTRIGESFLYADVIAGGESDIELALDVMGRLLAAPAA